MGSCLPGDAGRIVRPTMRPHAFHSSVVLAVSIRIALAIRWALKEELARFAPGKV